MKKNCTKNIEHYRLRTGLYGSCKADGANGVFEIPRGLTTLRVLASDGYGWDVDTLGPDVWEHVSVSLPDRCPTWAEMDYIKSIFWGDDETVMQLHVPAQDHINQHPYCLHLWRPKSAPIPRPPKLTVGV